MARGNGTKRLYIGNLPYDMDGDALVATFAEYGFTVSRPHIVMDSESGRSKGFGFVEIDAGSAVDAVAQCNGAVMGGRTVRVDHAIDRPKNERGPRR
jgi:RNA recognition motif-containing protein